MTTNQGVRSPAPELAQGRFRGPASRGLIPREDHPFDHERIPERVVHARDRAARLFECTSRSEVTSAYLSQKLASARRGRTILDVVGERGSTI